ncbi:type I-E CRISPR-associated protein Cas7/Cse4/CasC [bacterium]|nr:type I-E CRISPR-associated protein Cas7/Cse4/CasC [candidate division CSSED10-310 bacterium]
MVRFIQIHSLTSFPSALLNRDDAGFAKRIPFGGVSRTRISSQCLKRHWRLFRGDHSLADIQIPMSIRSRRSFEKFVAAPLRDSGFEPEIVETVVIRMMNAILGESESKKKKKSKEETSLESSQITVLGSKELSYFKNEAARLINEYLASDKAEPFEKYIDKCLNSKDIKKNLQALKTGAGLDAAMFGRMVTSDILARVDAAVHVAHAFTVHQEASEADYFTACDDLMGSDDEKELGAGHINSTELTSGLFYGYSVIDIPQLVSNLEGVDPREFAEADRSVAAEIVKRFIAISATVSPGAKVGSTAPYNYASMMFVECGNSQPRSLANAFLNPVSFSGSILQNTYTALAEYLGEFKSMYPLYKMECLLAGIHLPKSLLDVLNLNHAYSIDELTQWASGKIMG